MSPHRMFFDYRVPSCSFSSMSWVSSSTTACATTLVARAARAAGLVGARHGGGVRTNQQAGSAHFAELLQIGSTV